MHDPLPAVHCMHFTNLLNFYTINVNVVLGMHALRINALDAIVIKNVVNRNVFLS